MSKELFQQVIHQNHIQKPNLNIVWQPRNW